MERLIDRAVCDGYEDIGLKQGVTVGDAVCQLADYENTGLTPDEISILKQENIKLKEQIRLNSPITLDDGNARAFELAIECSKLQQENAKLKRGRDEAMELLTLAEKDLPNEGLEQCCICSQHKLGNQYPCYRSEQLTT